jgi:hypothetical protein
MKECDLCPTCGQGDLSLLPRCEWCRLPVSRAQAVKKTEGKKAIFYHPSCFTENEEWKDLPW